MSISLNIDLEQWALDHDTSINRLAQKAGISHTTLGAIAKGRAVPNGYTIAALVAATGLPFPQLFRIDAAA